MTARVFRDAGTDADVPGSAPEPDASAVAVVGGVLAEGPAEAATVTGTLRLRALGIQSTDQEASGKEDGPVAVTVNGASFRVYYMSGSVARFSLGPADSSDWKPERLRP
jgi:hypothetical protein